ncbi:DUF4232 domain-containing protein [Catenuloplanes japonicus]|uniref:DUF4232 domain-containing protein n=1 Tax=Catenuloplanes japonicus TaxID=33876 RepID=UPI00068DE0DD|nr:DUF4232 domain-containing protein [Catenuloplanes japonicus]
MKALRILPLIALLLLAGCVRDGEGHRTWTLWSPGDRSADDARGGEPVLEPPVVPSPTPRWTPPIECSADGLRMEFGEGDAAMGLRVSAVRLINCGTEPYRVDGVAQVRALDEDRQPLDVAILTDVGEISAGLDDLATTPSTFTLEPGGTAHAPVAWRNTYDNPENPPVDVVYLEVAPRPGSPALIVMPPGPLDLGSTGRFAFGPWKPAG